MTSTVQFDEINRTLTQDSYILSLSLLMMTLASGIVPMKVPPGQSNADILARACLARASVDHE